jgi:DNA-directed RNA polymerase II subunit RPB2
MAASLSINDLLIPDESDQFAGAEDVTETILGGAPKKTTPLPVEETSEAPVSTQEEPDGVIDDSITPEDMYAYILAEIKRRGIAGHHIDSMNTFYKIGIKQIATKVFVVEGRLRNQRTATEEDKSIGEITFRIDFTDITLTPPTLLMYKSGKPQLCTPAMARTKNLNYSAKMEIDATITATAHYIDGTTKTRTAEFKNHRIASIPCLVGTELCNTYGMSREAKKAIGEDPTDPGGYFIIHGSEWTIDCLENTTNNTFHVHRNMYQNEIVRGNFLSKPGDAFENSYQIILRYLNSGAITLEVNTARAEKVEIPFYVMFRAMGMTSDYDIVNHIVYGVNNADATTKELLQILQRAFDVDNPKFSPIKNETNPHKIIEFLGLKLNEGVNMSAVRKDDNMAKHLNNSALNVIDRYLFPHIGTSSADRIKKLRFLGHLINKLLCVYIGVLDPTDRDSYKSKRVHAAGTSLAKTFKTFFNIVVSTEAKNRLINDFGTVPFSQVNMVDSVKAAINSDDLEKMLVQAIVIGSDTIQIRHNTISNRMSSQTINHKNDLNVKSTLNTINTPDISASKSNDRADQLRRTHPTYAGFVDISQSADTGIKVGTQKQKACTASVSGATSSAILKAKLLSDSQVIPLDNVIPEEITARKLSKVFVNGDWIGCTVNGHTLVQNYRMRRRRGEIHYLTTIVIEILVREIYFWTDVGRLHRPLVIVYNNLQAYVDARRAGKPIQFKQWIKLTKDHIEGLRNGKISIDDLRKDRVIEYISPEEQESAFLAANIGTLRANAHNELMQYTHMDVDQALFGVVALAAPLAHHSNAVRITMYTNHRKQAAAWFALNWPHRIDKNATLQWYVERPLISTFSDTLTLPSTHNTIVALCCEGFGQEDSIIANADSIDCGLFNASFFNNERTELEKGEQFGNPEEGRTLEIKSEAIYEYTKDGFVQEGTLLRNGVVLMVKAAKLPHPVDMQYDRVDKSIIYRLDVSRVIVTRNAEDTPLAKVQWRATRPVTIGDKFCLTGDHDVLTSCGWKPIAEVTRHDLVAQLSDKRAEFVHPTEVFAYQHDDDIVVVKSHHISQKVTLNHKMYVRLPGYPNYELIEARHLIGQRVYYLDGLLNEHLVSASVRHYKGTVYCITVPSHVFCVRNADRTSWTGNSSRTGNKGICARRIPRVDMPYCEDGLVPDLLVNPHSIPTRMAINQIIECCLGQLAVKKGSFLDGTNFTKIDIDWVVKELADHGIKYGGTKRMYNGETGCWMDTLIFVGPTAYQRLQKFVIDENYANQTGPLSAATQQPVAGKQNNGGLRLGEMEVWVLNAHGTIRAFQEKFYKDSDGTIIYICRNCGNRAIVNEKRNIYKCKHCASDADISAVQSSHVANLWFNEASAANVTMKFELDPFVTVKKDE